MKPRAIRVAEALEQNAREDEEELDDLLDALSTDPTECQKERSRATTLGLRIATQRTAAELLRASVTEPAGSGSVH